MSNLNKRRYCRVRNPNSVFSEWRRNKFNRKDVFFSSRSCSINWTSMLSLTTRTRFSARNRHTHLLFTTIGLLCALVMAWQPVSAASSTVKWEPESKVGATSEVDTELKSQGVSGGEFCFARSKCAW